MLKALSIKDFAIIDELEVELQPGLNAMTGETGAGKTIIVEALKLVLGARASADIVRSGSERASVTAVFDSGGLPGQFRESMSEVGIECEDEVIVHRVVGQQGRGKISINGVPATASLLREVAAHLVDISSQHENQLLLDGMRHAQMLDDFAGLGPAFSSYLEAHRAYADASRELKELEANERGARERLDFLKFQLGELESADVKAGELESLESERSRIKHSVLLGERTTGAGTAISGEEASALSLIGQASQLLTQCSHYDVKASRWCEALDRARIELEEVSRDLSAYAEGLGSDPARLEAVEDRIHLIRGLVKKHGGSVEALISRRDEIAAEVDTVENYDEILARRREGLSVLAEKRSIEARSLGAARKKAARDMGRKVAHELADLGMAKTEFVVAVERRDEGAWDETGPDSVEFMISPNVGEPLMPLARIASGGELSRIMLALKGALAQSREIASTSVFDEVDAGIGGAVAAVVGKKLRGLAASRQVICITHLPQVAAFADAHLRITKGVRRGRTIASLDSLDGDGRVSEIARMLGGETITDATLAHAREMVDSCTAGGS